MLASVYTHLGPYFSVKVKNIKTVAGVVAILVTSLMITSFDVALNEGFEALLDLLGSQALTYSALYTNLLSLTTSLMVLVSAYVFQEVCQNWLTDVLTHRLTKDTLEKWIKDDGYYGIKLLSAHTPEPLNGANVIANDIRQLVSTTVYLFSDFSTKAMMFATSARYLWLQTTMVSFEMAGLSLALPFMPLTAFAYGVIYATGMYYYSRRLKHINDDLSAKRDTQSSMFHHIQERADALALKKGAKHEHQALNRLFASSKQTLGRYRFVSSVSSFLNSLHDNMSFMMAIILCVPSVFDKTMKATGVFSVANYFSGVVSGITWPVSNMESMISLESQLSRLDQLNALLERWHTMDKTSHVKRDGSLEARDVSIRTPDGALIFQDLNFTIKPGTRTLIQGASGLGKSTYLKALAGLWPFIEGESSLPSRRFVFIPQKPYFPQGCTLAQAICFPKQNVSKKDLTKIKQAMVKLGLAHHFPSLHKKENVLDAFSGGEQQAFTLIGALLKKPSLLFMDEATSALDHERKVKALKLVRQWCPTSTIVSIDHNPLSQDESQGFYHQALVLKKAMNRKIDATVKPLGEPSRAKDVIQTVGHDVSTKSTNKRASTH